METQANVWAMNRIRVDGLEALKALRNRIKLLSKEATKEEIVRLDFEFHKLIYQQTRNHQLASLLERLLSHYLRFWLSSPGQIEPEVFFGEALEIMEAIEAKDEVRLRAASSSHIMVSLDMIMGLA